MKRNRGWTKIKKREENVRRAISKTREEKYLTIVSLPLARLSIAFCVLLFECVPAVDVQCDQRVYTHIRASALRMHQGNRTSDTAKIRQTRAHAVPFILAEIPISTQLNESVYANALQLDK